MLDVVDAFYLDGWWVGVVSRAVQGSTKFLVSFENSGEEMEFDRSDLRQHYEWVGGKWEKHPKKMEVMLREGTAIEISLRKKYNSVWGWRLGTVLRVTGSNKLEVEYQCLGAGNKAEYKKGTVDSLHIRPVPPSLEDKDFVLLDKVDVYYDFCWRTAKVSRLLEGRKYVVILEFENKEMEFHHSKLRAHMDWTDGKWIIASQGTNQFSTQHNQPLLKWSRQKRRTNKPEVGRHFVTATGQEDNAGIKIEDVEKECSIKEVGTLEVKDALAVDSCETPSKACSNIMENQKQQIVDPEIQRADEINGSTKKESNRKRGRPRKSLHDKQIGSVGGDKKLLSGLHRHHDTLSELTDNPLAESQTNEIVARKRLKVLCRSLSSEHDEIMKVADSESQSQDWQEALREKTSESNEMNYEKNGDELLIDGFFNDTTDDQTLVMWLRDKPNQTSTVASPVGSLEQRAKAIDKEEEIEIPLGIATNVGRKSIAVQGTITNELEVSHVGNLDQSTKAFEREDKSEIPSAINDNVKASGLQKTITYLRGVTPRRSLDQNAESNNREGELQTPSAMPTSNSVVKNQNLPFVKSSPVWKIIEAMDIFHKTVQQPHFSPLEKFNEDTREGLAVAQMVTFSNLVEKASKLHFSDPRKKIESSLEALDELDLHGFDVRAIRLRLTDLLSKKNEEAKLRCECEDIENQLTKCILEKTEFEEEINGLREEIELKMSELKEKLTMATSKKEKKEQEISAMRWKLDVVHQNVQSLGLDYETLVVSPW